MDLDEYKRELNRQGAGKKSAPKSKWPDPRPPEEKPQQQKGKKFGNVVQVVDGVKFDSNANRRYEGHLMLLVRAGKYVAYEREVLFLIYAQSGRVLYKYKADFVAYETGYRRVIIDIKTEATMTAKFRLVAKLFEEQYGEQIVCIDSKTWVELSLDKRRKKK